MSRAFLYGLATLALTAVTWPSVTAQAATLRCATSVGLDGAISYIAFGGTADRAGDVTATFFRQADEAIRLAQLKAKLSGRVPAGETYYLQRGTQGTFQKFAAGTALPGLDCIEVNCPASFPPDTTCWRCVEQIKAPE